MLIPLLATLAEAGWRDLLRRGNDPEPRAVVCGRYVVISDYDLPTGTAATIARQLDTLHARLERELGLGETYDVSQSRRADTHRSPEQLRIYLFATHRAFSSYVREHVPYLTRSDMHRDAMFLLRYGTPYVFAVRTEDLLRNLRHEYVHVYLNAAIPGVPVWLDEGLAQFYENNHEDGRNDRALAILDEALRSRWSPDLVRLERIETMSEMGRREYAEAWSWIAAAHSTDPQLIASFLLSLRTSEAATTFQDHLAVLQTEPEVVWSVWRHVRR